MIRDHRRIDPVTGQVREAGGVRAGRTSGAGRAGARGAQGSRHGSGPASRPAPRPPRASRTSEAGTPGSRAVPDRPRTVQRTQPRTAAGRRTLRPQLAERTADLQRLQAEYANYRKRVERDRAAVREQALANVLAELLPVLDDIGRAREHGELTGGFKSVAESLEAGVGQARPGALRRAGRAVRPDGARGADALATRRTSTEPTCVADPPAGLPGRRPDPAPGPGRGRGAQRRPARTTRPSDAEPSGRTGRPGGQLTRRRDEEDAG